MITLRKEKVCGRNFCGFFGFWNIRKSLFPQKVRSIVNRKSFFPQHVLVSPNRKSFFPQNILVSPNRKSLFP